MLLSSTAGQAAKHTVPACSSQSASRRRWHPISQAEVSRPTVLGRSQSVNSNDAVEPAASDAKSKNEAQLAKVLADFAALQERQKLSGEEYAEDEYEDEAEGEEGKDWVWWRASDTTSTSPTIQQQPASISSTQHKDDGGQPGSTVQQAAVAAAAATAAEVASTSAATVRRTFTVDADGLIKQRPRRLGEGPLSAQPILQPKRRAAEVPGNAVSGTASTGKKSPASVGRQYRNPLGTQPPPKGQSDTPKTSQ